MSRSQVVRALPMALALSMVAAVWVAGAVWSFEEQTAFAAAAGFLVPWLLPLTLDGLALALASVAWAASLDGRAAVPARLGTGLAIAASAASNARWAAERTGGDPSAVMLAAGVPVASFMAFEVLLAELRRQVHRRRGLPAPVAVPWPRTLRLALAPRVAFVEWRGEVLRLTAPASDEPQVPPYGPLADLCTAEHEAFSRDVEALRSDLLALGSRLPVPAIAAATSTTRAQSSARAKAPEGSAPAVPDDLLEVASEIVAELSVAGTSLTVRSLAAGFRSRGQSMSNDRASAVLRALRTTTTAGGQPR